MPRNPHPEKQPSPHEVEIDRSRIAEIGARLPAAAQPLNQVVPDLVALTVSEAAFTSFTYTLAVAYNEIEAFTIAESRRLTDDTEGIRDDVAASARNWRYAEDAGSLREI